MPNSKSKSIDFGITERATKRNMRGQQVEKHVQHLISRHLVELTKIEVLISNKSYEKGIQSLLLNLTEDYPQFTDYRIARNCLAIYINEGNKTGRWQLNVPAYIHRVQRESTFRNYRWFKSSKALNAWNHKWISTLTTKSAISARDSQEEILGSCLVSAAIFGGLCIPEAMSALKDELIRSNKPIISAGKELYFDLIFDAKSQSHNVIKNDKTLTLRRWYPDTTTLAWILHYLSIRELFQSELKSTAWSLIKEILDKVDGQTTKTINGFKTFCYAAIGVTENKQDIILSQVIVEYLVGRVPSASLQQKHHELAFGGNSFQSIQSPTEQRQIDNHLTSFNRRIPKHNTTNYESAIAIIRASLSLKNYNGTKKSPRNAILELESIVKEHHDSSLYLLVDWLIHMLNNKMRVSSVLRYWSAMGKAWLAHTASVQLGEFDSEDFESLYRDMIDGEISEKSRQYMAGRLDQFHLYISRFYGFPILSSNLSDASQKVKPFIQAAFIPEKAFSAFLETLSKMNEAPFVIQTLRCLFIVAYRTGLRRGELVKLQMGDVEESEERWLFIRNNRYGNNKSSSALRKIPLSLLLTPDEKQEFDTYYSHKKLIQKGDNVQLFSEAQSPHIPLDANRLSALCSNFLGRIMGVSSRFHHLRHSALSRLQIILESEQDLIETLTPYSQNQVDNIQRFLGGGDHGTVKRDIYWAISGFAGHNTPETTFANYLHFTDIIAARRLHRVICNVPTEFIKLASGLSSNTLTRLSTKVGGDQTWHAMFRQLIEKKLVSYTEIFHIEQSNSKENQVLNYTLPQKSNPSIEVCYAVLQDAEANASLNELVLRYSLEEELINKWIQNASALSLEYNQKGRSRLFSKDKVQTPSKQLLAPAKPQSNAELSDANIAIKKLRNLYIDNRQEIVWCIDYFLSRKNTTNPGITFGEVEDVRRFFALMTQVFSNNRWRISLQLVQRNDRISQLDYWKKDIDKFPPHSETYVANKSSIYPFGKLMVTLRHPNEKMIIEKRRINSYSTNTLSYVSHMLMIMLH